MVKENKLKIMLATGFAVIIPITSIGIANFALSKKNPYDGNEITTSHVQEIPSYSEPSIDINEQYEFNSLDDLKIELSTVLNQKEFEQEINIYIQDIITDLYYNYDSYYSICQSLGLPEKETYIREIINIIDKNVSNIIIVDTKNEKNKYYTEMLDSAKGRFIIADDLILINQDCPTKKTTIFEEIIHASQDSLFKEGNFSGELSQLFIEGEANMHKFFLNSNMEYVAKKSVYGDGFRCFISGPTSTINSAYCKYYTMLFTLTDYNTMLEGKNSLDKTTLINKIQSNFDIDGNQFVQLIEEILHELKYGSDQQTIDKICEVERMYCECLKQKLNLLDSAEDIEQFLNFYRYYKMQYQIQCKKYDENYNETNITLEKMTGYVEVEQVLFNKTMQFNMLPVGIEKTCFDFLTGNIKEMELEGQSMSIKNIMYYVNNDNIVFTNKNTKKMFLINSNTNSYSTIDYDDDIYEQSISVFESQNEKYNVLV